MTLETGLGPFYNIATLPQPLDTENGRIQAAITRGLSNGQVRKRHEVVAAIDGDGLYIHNVSFEPLALALVDPI